MPTLLSAGSPNDVKIRFREQYVSQGLNQKLTGIAAPGIFRGGRLVTNASALQVRIEPDVDRGDSVYVFEDKTNGYSLTYRQIGNEVLDLSAFASSTVYVALYVEYVIGVTTVVEWRGYTEAELFGAVPVTEADDVIIVGKVDVPGAGPITASLVTPDKARFAFAQQAQGVVAWEKFPLPGFDAPINTPASSSGDQAAAGWTMSEAPTGGDIVLSGIAHRGVAGLVFLFTSSGNPNSVVASDGLIRLNKGSGDALTLAKPQYLRGEVWLNFNTFDLTLGSDPRVGLEVEWLDGSLATVSTEMLANYDISSLTLPYSTANFEKAEGVARVPDGVSYARIKAVVRDTGGTSVSGNIAFDSPTVYVEPFSPTQESQHIEAMNFLASLLMKDGAATGPGFQQEGYLLQSLVADELSLDKLGNFGSGGSLGSDDWLLQIFGRILANRGVLGGESLDATTAAGATRARFDASLGGADPTDFACLFRSSNEGSTSRRFGVFTDANTGSIWLTVNADLIEPSDASALRYVVTGDAYAVVLGRNGAMEILFANGTAGNAVSWGTDATDANTPRIYTDMPNLAGNDSLMLLWQIPIGENGYSVRIYASEEVRRLQDAGFVVTTNAVWDNTANTWQKDNNSFGAVLFGITGNGMFVGHKQPGAVAAWDNEFQTGGGSENAFGWDRTLLGTSWIDGSDRASVEINNPWILLNVAGSPEGSNVTASTNLSSGNYLTAKNLIKAWGQIDINSGTILTPGLTGTTSDGFQVGSYVLSDANLSITVTFDNGFQDEGAANVGQFGYCVLVATEGNQNTCTVERIGGTSFKIRSYDVIAGALENFSSGNHNLFWAVLGNHVD